MINVLLYLFNREKVDKQIFTTHRLEIQQELAAERFPPHAITQALNWLKELKEQITDVSLRDNLSSNSIRIWLPSELTKLGIDALDFLSDLENQSVLNAWQREIIIDRAMAINTPRVDLEVFKSITLMVLYHYQKEGVSIPWIEHVLTKDTLKMH